MYHPHISLSQKEYDFAVSKGRERTDYRSKRNAFSVVCNLCLASIDHNSHYLLGGFAIIDTLDANFQLSAQLSLPAKSKIASVHSHLCSNCWRKLRSLALEWNTLELITQKYPPCR